jgi:hypothetical protein
MEDIEQNKIARAIVGLGGLILFPLSFLLDAYCAHKLLVWYHINYDITILQLIGLQLIYTILFRHAPLAKDIVADRNNKWTDELVIGLGYIVARPLLGLILGWLYIKLS